MLLAGSTCKQLCKALREQGAVSEVVVERFPDGELYVRTPEITDKQVTYLQACYPGQDDAFMEALLTVDAVHEQDAQATPVFTYFAYAKQDAVFKKGEALSVRALLNALKGGGVQTVHFINTHFLKKPGTTSKWGVRCTNHNAAPLLLEHVAEKHDAFTVVLPGSGAAHLVNDVEIDAVKNVVTVGTERDTYEEDGRNVSREPQVTTTVPRLENRVVVVLDDMIATGETMEKTCEAVENAGADQVIAAAVHGLFLEDAAERIRKHADTIITTDTVQNPYIQVSVAGLLADVAAELR